MAGAGFSLERMSSVAGDEPCVLIYHCIISVIIIRESAPACGAAWARHERHSGAKSRLKRTSSSVALGARDTSPCIT